MVSHSGSSFCNSVFSSGLGTGSVSVSIYMLRYSSQTLGGAIKITYFISPQYRQGSTENLCTILSLQSIPSNTQGGDGSKSMCFQHLDGSCLKKEEEEEDEEDSNLHSHQKGTRSAFARLPQYGTFANLMGQ